jgi:hypothetical protein
MEHAEATEAMAGERRTNPGRVVFFVVVSIFAIGIGVVLRRVSPPPSTSAPATATAAPETTTASPIVPVAVATPAAPVAKTPAQLPRGGRQIFPQHRLVGFCGTPGASKLGRLRGNLPRIAKQIDTLAEEYGEDERKPLPVFELIAVIAQGERGADGKSRRRVPDKIVEEYLEAARADKALLLLNIQPGHSDFLTEAKHFEKFLREPDVGLALDPEWAMTNDRQTPGAAFGRTSGGTIDEVAQYLATIVKDNDLPEKALVFHQVNSRVLEDEAKIVPRPGVVLIKSVDGLGARANKTRTYETLVAGAPPGIHLGFKLFFDEDVKDNHKLMTPAQVLELDPTPEYVMYE